MDAYSGPPLGPEERARLRPLLDVDAWERLLGRMPPNLRAITLLHFYEAPTAREAVDALEASGVETAVVSPLDESNVGRFDSKVEELSVKTQFIVIKHNKRTMVSSKAL